jgi:AcrR family transcriptional regulator
MTVPYELTGRVGQKSRTRDALIAAARGLLAHGVTPTMEGAAAAAAISRTTAYRYFPSRRALLAAAYPHVDQTSLLGDDPPADPLARLARVADDQTCRILRNEAEMRTVLRLSLEDAPPDMRLPMHRGMRISWIEEALAPLQGVLPDEQLRRLVLGIGATLGIEAFSWLTDIGRVPREEAAAIIRTNAQALLRSALSPNQGT